MIMVSIQCLVYNHEHYLRQCLDGFVTQKTDFQFEAIVHDDASTDGSAAIIHEYAERFPNIIKPIYQTENQHSKGDGSLTRIVTKACTGKYIAICEGDDYWIDPLKLQKQVDYLEAHPECTLCFTNAMITWVDNTRPDSLFSALENKDYSGIEIAENWIIPTASVVFRKEILFSDKYNRVFNNKKISVVGDTPLFLTCAKYGKLHALPEVTCVYRRHNGGYLLSADSNRKIQLGDYRLELFKVFGREYKKIAVFTALSHYRIALWHAKNENNYRNFFRSIGRVLNTYLSHPAICCSRIKQILKEKRRIAD